MPNPIDPNAFGFTALQAQLLRELIEKVLLPGQIVDMWIFGSRARGTHRRYSDVDIVISTKAGAAFSHRQKLELQDAIEDSDFPYKVEWVLEPDIYPPYRPGIMADRKILFPSLANQQSIPS